MIETLVQSHLAINPKATSQAQLDEVQLAIAKGIGFAESIAFFERMLTKQCVYICKDVCLYIKLSLINVLMNQHCKHVRYINL